MNVPAKGMYVSWQPILKTANRRFGCVMSDPGEDGRVLVQASNGQHRILVEALRPEPDCEDCITADQKGIYSQA